MKRTYKLDQRLIACILLINLFLQSCSNSSVPTSPNEKAIKNIQVNPPTELDSKPTISTTSQLLTDPIDIEQLVGKQLTAEGGHLVTSAEEGGILQANVEINAPDEFSKTYTDLPVEEEIGAISHVLSRGGQRVENTASTKAKNVSEKRDKGNDGEEELISQPEELKKELEEEKQIDREKKEFKGVSPHEADVVQILKEQQSSKLNLACKQLNDGDIAVQTVNLSENQTSEEEEEIVHRRDNVAEEQLPEPSSPPLPEEERDLSLPHFENGGKEDEGDDVSILDNAGSQITLGLINEGESLLDESFIQEMPSQTYLRRLRVNLQNFTPEEIEDLETILKVEGSWKNHVVWANFEVLIHKFLFALTTNKFAINRKKQKACCDPLWLHGGPIPLDSSSAIKRNVILKTFGNSLEEGIIESIHTILLALMGYQFGKSVESGEWALDFGSMASFYFIDADDVSYLGTIRTLHNYPALFALLGIPLVYAMAKTVYNYLQISEPTDKAVNEDLRSLTNRSRKWDSMIFNILSVIPALSTLLNFHPLKRKISGLTSLILWEGRLPQETRENAFTALLDLAHNRTGFSKMAALESLARLTHGLNIRNLLQRPHDVEDLLHIKLRAFHALKEIYKEISTCSLNKFRTAALLWDIGQSPSWVISIIEPINKAFRAVLYTYALYGIIDVLIKFFTCPEIYLESFSWVGGLEPYASDYSKECFDVQVAAFNTLPGQPASTLVGDLGRYHFPGPYDLDLSNKSIQGPVLAEIVEGFKKASVPLKSLNVSFNEITNSSDVARILAALSPEIINMDMTNTNSGYSYSHSHHFLGLGRLTGLQSLNISHNGLLSGDIGDIGQALQNLCHLKELRLAWEGFHGSSPNTNITHIAQSLKPSLTLLDLTGFLFGSDFEGQIALGNALAKTPTLKQLYLGSTGIGNGGSTNTTLQEAAVVALAHGLSAQQNLHILDLSANSIGNYANMNTGGSFLLSSLPPSLTHLDVSNNLIGLHNSLEVKALAQAVQQMSELTSFKMDYNNPFMNSENWISTDLLKALQKKEKLTALGLSFNFFNDTLQMRDLLQTTPNLETLDLSYNQLTHGSILAPTLSTLRKLKSLNLGGNNFTTADCMNLWKATHFLSQSPIPLDEDLNFTSMYLKSLNSTILSLNLSGLIPYDPTAFETIMPQIINLFPNLRELDLSNNNILAPYTNGTITMRGIQALTTHLPRLTHLRSLRMSATGGLSGAYPPVELITFSQIIGQLQNLHTLDFSNTEFLVADAFGKGLENIHSLSSINLAGCWFLQGSLGPWQGGVQLMQGLQAQSNLIHLDLSYNPIGSSSGPNSTLALAYALNSWPKLQSLNLANNAIGYKDPNSVSTFLGKLADLAETVNKQGRTLEVDLVSGISNVIWTQEAQVLQTLTQQKIEDACARQLCTGDLISKPTQSKTQALDFQQEWDSIPDTTSGAISSHQVPWYSPAKWVTALKLWWQGSDQAIDMSDPQIEELARFKERCDRLVAIADTRSADRWYRFSLEDLREDVEEGVNNPIKVNEDTIKNFYRRLDGIDRDFLREPLLKKTSFFAPLNLLVIPPIGTNNSLELGLIPILLLRNSSPTLALRHL